MGRMAAHTGQIITFDQMMNCEHEFAPDVDKLTLDGPRPCVAAADGKYPRAAAGHPEDPRILTRTGADAASVVLGQRRPELM